MTRFASIISGRRTKWAVVAAWIVLVAILAGPGGKLADETNDQTEGFLPAGAESTRVLNLLGDRFEGGETTEALVVYRRAGGLAARDRAKIAADARRAAQRLPTVGLPQTPFDAGAGRGQVSADRDIAYTVVTLPDDNENVADWGKALRDITGEGGGGLEVYMTGGVGFQTDAEEVFSSIDTRLLLATVLLVLILLGAIYRSPAIALTPLVVVGFAYAVAQGLIYFFAKSGATVSTNATSILIVLMFGVGTDYCLLRVSRYREELRRFEDKHAAMSHALCRTGPAILASGMTVALSMLVLLVAENRGIQSLGPVAAIGVTCSFAAGLTLLPALLTIGGRRAFWPRRSAVEWDPEHAVHVHRGLWRRLGDRVLRRPGLALAGTLVLFGIGALGLLAYKEDYSTTTFFKKETESVEGFKVLERSLPAGALSPLTVLVEREEAPVRPADVARARRIAASQPGVATVTPPVGQSRDGRIARFDVILEEDPFKSGALGIVPDLRDRIDTAAAVRVLVGGGTAIQYDYDRASARDLKVIVPIALAVITLILAVLLQALVAPLVLIASVVVSFFGTFGLSLLFIRYVVGDAGIDNGLPTFAFIFLVALGIDYTIFLMSRVREEARRHGTREGMLRALGATGPVITSAGIILAGTFSVLMTLPVTFAFDLGFMVALGILLDTFVVRTIMVPAAVELLGDRVWWPSGPGGGARIIDEMEPEERAGEPGPAVSVS